MFLLIAANSRRRFESVCDDLRRIPLTAFANEPFETWAFPSFSATLHQSQIAAHLLFANPQPKLFIPRQLVKEKIFCENVKGLTIHNGGRTIRLFLRIVQRIKASHESRGGRGLTAFVFPRGADQGVFYPWRYLRQFGIIPPSIIGGAYDWKSS